jgi:hypothetical protein
VANNIQPTAETSAPVRGTEKPRIVFAPPKEVVQPLRDATTTGAGGSEQ